MEYGSFKQYKKKNLNLKKQNRCSCGYKLGGKSIPKIKTKLHNNPLSVIVYENTLGTFVKLILSN